MSDLCEALRPWEADLCAVCDDALADWSCDTADTLLCEGCHNAHHDWKGGK